jgi:sigma-E factor negative regulatory protein RseB
MRWARLALAFLFTASLASGGEADNPSQWLDRLSRSMSELSYRGVLTYERGDHTESLRLSHQLVDGREYERLEYLDGERREIIRSGSQLTCIHPGQRLIRLFQKQQLLRDGLSGLDHHYELRAVGEGRVAGRRAQTVEITPRDEFRLGYRLALDHDTGLLLRSELLGAGGEVLERFQVATFELGNGRLPDWVAGAESAPDTEGAPAAMAASVDGSPAMAVPAWQPQWLPPGFRRALAPAPGVEDIQTYSDGRAMVSVFVAAVDDTAQAEEGRARQGATVAYTRPTQFRGKSYLVTVVGEVPQLTAKRIATGIAWQAGQ